jgi:NAD(P)-dependent dehydrogenase (short-subunit alcohol dehydrogenase family)
MSAPSEAGGSIFDELFSLRGKVALVTGAAGGIGQVLALGLARAGASLVLCDLQVNDLAGVSTRIESAGGRSKGYFVDLTGQRSIRTMVEEVKRDFGRVDILVNCAAINKREPILEVEESTFDKIVNVNLRGLFQLTQAIVPLMPESGGKVIHIGSINSEMGLAGVSVYGATKGAVKQLTKVMAVEWAERNIQVNCIIPGFMLTPLSAPMWEDAGKSQWMRDRIAAGRPGEPGELLGLTLYLASQASSYVTGQAIVVDGGVLAGGSHW